MRRVPLASLLRLLVFAGIVTFVNPSGEQVDLNQVWVEIPAAPVALGGDVHVHVHGLQEGGVLRVHLAREDDDGRTQLATMPLALDTENRMILPCGYFSRGGSYYLELLADKDNLFDERTNTSGFNNDNLVKRDVEEGTIMETGDSIVKSWRFNVLWPTAKLDVTPEQIQTYPERQVTAILEFPRVVCTPVETSADFWLELLYCGHSSGGAVLCDGKNTSSHAHVLYSEQMHGFPGRRTMTLRCELFGQAGDYALTLRPAAAAGPQDLAAAFIKADWSDQFVLNVHGGSVFPCWDGVRVLFQYPECVLEGADRVRVFGRDEERLRYVAERRVIRGQHSALFDCDLFSERYPEYCFVYVSQAVTGAVADVRMDCLPTVPMSDGAAAAWGEWSPWSACPAPAHCSTRTRSRHRFCDSPPPAYGAKYCEAEEGLVVRLRIESVRLPCTGQALRARDGDSLGSPLLASWDGPDSPAVADSDVLATKDSTGVVEIAGGRHILVELRSVDTSERCAGGFLAHASQVEPIRNASAAWASVSNYQWWLSGGGARGAAVGLAAIAALGALCLALYSAHRTKAYQRAADKESLTDSDACSASLELIAATSGSRSTLLSEVVDRVSLRRLLLKTRHTRLRDSDRVSVHADQRDEEDQNSDIEAEVEDNVSEGSDRSGASQHTITPGNISPSSAAATQLHITPSPLRRSHTISAEVTPQDASLSNQYNTESTIAETSIGKSSLSVRDDTCSEKDRDSMWEKERSESRASSSNSSATLTNGWYSPALSGVSAARVRDNPKHTKESCNRRLLRSDLSLTSHAEMEIDYYDYEVNNAGSAPGSYLGMDPAFLVWIPPLEDGEILPIDNQAPIYEEILPKELHPHPGSNTESPEDQPTSSTLKRSSDNRSVKSNDSIKSTRKVVNKTNIIHPLNFSINDLQSSPKLSKRKKKREDDDAIQMKDLSLSESPIKVHRRERADNDNTSTLKRVNDSVRETDSDSLRRNIDISEIKFADENSDSSNDIRFADDSPDSNKLRDKFDVKA